MIHTRSFMWPDYVMAISWISLNILRYNAAKENAFRIKTLDTVTIHS